MLSSFKLGVQIAAYFRKIHNENECKQTNKFSFIDISGWAMFSKRPAIANSYGLDLRLFSL